MFIRHIRKLLIVQHLQQKISPFFITVIYLPIHLKYIAKCLTITKTSRNDAYLFFVPFVIFKSF